MTCQAPYFVDFRVSHCWSRKNKFFSYFRFTPSDLLC